MAEYRLARCGRRMIEVAGAEKGPPATVIPIFVVTRTCIPLGGFYRAEDGSQLLQFAVCNEFGGHCSLREGICVYFFAASILS